MSIIQDALKKAQGDFTEKKVPQEKHDIAQGEPVNSRQAQPDAGPHTHREHRRSPSMRLPALVSILTILLLTYGLGLSAQYTKRHDNALRVPKNTAQPVVNKMDGTGIDGILGQANKLSSISFMDPRKSLLVLSGIMYVDGRPQAIINGQVLEEGDKISGATILMIEKDCVLLDMNDTNVRLEINK